METFYIKDKNLRVKKKKINTLHLVFRVISGLIERLIRDLLSVILKVAKLRHMTVFSRHFHGGIKVYRDEKDYLKNPSLRDFRRSQSYMYITTSFA